jgi:hypothetical protein
MIATLIDGYTIGLYVFSLAGSGQTGDLKKSGLKYVIARPYPNVHTN